MFFEKAAKVVCNNRFCVKLVNTLLKAPLSSSLLDTLATPIPCSLSVGRYRFANVVVGLLRQWRSVILTFRSSLGRRLALRRVVLETVSGTIISTTR